MNIPPFFFAQSIDSLWQAAKRRFRQWTKPDNRSLPLNAALDLDRTRLELMLENARLRQQIIILERQSKRPELSWRDRTIIVFLTSKLRTWKEALKIVQPDTVLRWHRDLFRSRTGPLGLAASGAFSGDEEPDRSVDSSATARSHAIWGKTTILDPGQ